MSINPQMRLLSTGKVQEQVQYMFSFFISNSVIIITYMGISFARSSNILSSVNKYGMPTVLPSQQKPPEDEDPLDAFMREIEGQAIQDKQVTLQHQKELEEKAQRKLLKEKQLLEKLQGKTDQKESIVETIDNTIYFILKTKFDIDFTSAVKVKQVEQFQSKNFKYDDDSEEETQKYFKRSHQGGNHQKQKDSEKDEVMSDGIDDSEQALLDRQEALLDGNGNLDYEKLRQMEKKGIQALNGLDHTQIEYDSFQKNFYQEHPDITAMSFEDVNYTRQVKT